MPNPRIKNEDQYEALRDKGYSKEKAARIANTPNSGKKGGQFKVFVRNKKTGKVIKVTFGSREMRSRLGDPAARKSFVARHKCKQTKDRTSARYWSCRLGRYPHLTGAKKRYTWW